MIKTIRSYLDTWETFLEDRYESAGPPRAGRASAGRPQGWPACMEADPARLNRRHLEAHGSELVSFLDAYPIQA
jgi:hypothetical protein